MKNVRSVTSSQDVLRLLYKEHPSKDIWAHLEAELETLGPALVHDAELRIAAGPEALPGFNDGQRLILGIGLGLHAVRNGRIPDVRYEPFLSQACDQSRDDKQTCGDGNLRALELLVEILQKVPIERRERLMIQDRYQNRKLAWRLAIESKTLTTEVARRAAWKIADLGNRRNSGGTYSSPTLEDHERALFEALGDTAVPELMREYEGGAHRRDFIVEVLGETRCPAAASALVRLLGEGSPTIQERAKSGLSKLIQAKHSDAIFEAITALLEDKRALQIGAAKALSLLPDAKQREVATAALKKKRHDSVKALLEPMVK